MTPTKYLASGSKSPMTILCLLILVLVCAKAEDVRDILMKLARQRIEVMYSDLSQFEDPRTSGDIVMRLSKEDKQCAPHGEKEGVPLTFLEFELEGVRPVDAFNVMTEFIKQPSWDTSCNAAANLGNFKSQRARAAAMGFSAAPLSTREMYEWQVVAANFSTEEFWVTFSTLNGESLHERKPNMDGAVEAQNCLASYRFQKSKKGVHATTTQQINAHPFPLTPRFVAQQGFESLVTWIKAFQVQAKHQADLGWNATRVNVPGWMLHTKNCTVIKPDTDLRKGLLAKAVTEFNRVDRGSPQPALNVPDGKMWQRSAQCGNVDVRTQNLPMWQLEFRIPDVSPEELFNMLAAKVLEPSWNKQLSRAELLQFSGGARGVHEGLAVPSSVPHFLPGSLTSPRELWEWQAANHSIDTREYLLVLSSQAHSSTAPFDVTSIEAAQCLAAYQISPADAGGTFVRMLTQPNPNEYSIIGKLSPLWHSLSERMLSDLASDISKEAQRLASARKQGQPFPIDTGVLTLLSPVPPARNASLSLQNILEMEHGWHRAFAHLDIPAKLNASSNFDKEVATAVQQLGIRLRPNATVQEFSLLRKQASDSLDLQLQGEALAAIQWRILEQRARSQCKGSGWQPPDIDNNTGASGFTFVQLICISLAVLLLIIGLVVGCCCGCRRYRRRKREQQLNPINSSFLGEQQVSMAESPQGGFPTEAQEA